MRAVTVDPETSAFADSDDAGADSGAGAQIKTVILLSDDPVEPEGVR